MGSLEHHLRDPQYANWVKNGLALKIANETIKPYVVNELGTFHNSIIEKCSRGSTLEHEITKSHRYGKPTLYISDGSKWMTDSWEVAKCYMPPMRGYGSCTAADADFSTVVNIVINNLHFVPLVTCDLTDDGNIFYRGRVMRNKIMHSNDLRVNDTDFNHNMDLIIEILEAFNPVLTGLNEAVDKIQKLRTGKLTLSLDDVLDVRWEARMAIMVEVERGKSELGRQVGLGTLAIKEYVEEEKRKVKEAVDREIERLRKEILSMVTLSEEQRVRKNFVDGCRHALLKVLQYQMNILRPKRSKKWALQDFLEKIELSPEIGRFSERHRELLYPITDEPNPAETWGMFLLCQVPLIETKCNPSNNLILFIKDLKNIRDQLLETPGSVRLEDLLTLCDYLDDPLKQSTMDIFSRNTIEADTVQVDSQLWAWKSNENDFEMKRVSEDFLNENKKLVKRIEDLEKQIIQLEEKSDKRFEEQQQETDKRFEEQKQETDRRLEEEKKHTEKQLDTLKAMILAQSVNEGGDDKGARPKFRTDVELIPKNCYKDDSLKIQKNITSENNNRAKENGSINRFKEMMDIDDTKSKEGSIIFEVTCSSITQLIAFWDKCMDGRAIEALSEVRDTYREFTNCKDLEFDVVLTKKEVERCMNQIVDDLQSRVNAMGSAGKPDQPTIFKKPDVLVKDAEESDKSFEPAPAAGEEINVTLVETFETDIKEGMEVAHTGDKRSGTAPIYHVYGEPGAVNIFGGNNVFGPTTFPSPQVLQSQTSLEAQGPSLVERSEHSANEEEANRLVKFLRQVAENLEGGQISVVKQHLDVIVQHAQTKDKKGFDDAVETFINTATFQSGISVNLIKQAVRGFLIMLEEPAFGVLVARKINSIEQEEKKEVSYSAESSKALVAGPSTVKSSVLIEEDIEVGAVDDAQGLDKIRRIQEQEKEKAASDPTLKSLDHPEVRVFPQKSTSKPYERETSTSSTLDVSDPYLSTGVKLTSDVKKPAVDRAKAFPSSEFESAQKKLGLSEKPGTHQYEEAEPSDPKAKLKSSKETDVSYGDTSPK